MTQAQAAAAARLSLRQWLKAEQSQVRATWALYGRLLPLGGGERCLLYRLRLGWTQALVAEKAGYCRTYIAAIERGDARADNLLWWWEQ